MISYENFWKTLKKKNITNYYLTTHENISKSTLSRLRKNQGVSTYTIDKLCKILNCKVCDIMEYIPDNKK